MKVLPLVISWDGIELDENDKKRDSREIVKTVIENIILVWARDNKGLDEKDRRKYYKIIDQIETAIENKANEVEVDEEKFGFLRKCFREARLMPNKILQRIEESIFTE